MPSVLRWRKRARRRRGRRRAHRVFVDVVKTDASDACEPTATVVVEFHAHDEDSTTNAARALEWFDNAVRDANEWAIVRGSGRARD